MTKSIVLPMTYAYHKNTGNGLCPLFKNIILFVSQAMEYLHLKKICQICFTISINILKLNKLLTQFF